MHFTNGSVNRALIVILLLSGVGLAAADAISVGIVSERIAFAGFLVIFILWFTGFHTSKTSITKA
ncbi:MAG: hypothetical protein P8J68_08315 [Arenicellaceae bacterium]|nr:hypothetical protein [Arenicellaceae bacterium]